MRIWLERLCLPILVTGILLAGLMLILETSAAGLAIGLAGFVMFLSGGIYYMMRRLQA